jgi:hypothetical protein
MDAAGVPYNVPMRLPLWQAAFTLCLPLVFAGAQTAAQNPQTPRPTKPDFENDQVIVNPPQTPPWPGAGDSGTDIIKSCATLPPADRKICAEDHPWHNHGLNRVVLRYYPGSEDLFYVDGTVEHLKWPAGAVEWSPASGFHYGANGVWNRPAGSTSGPVGMYLAIKKAGYPGKVAGTALDPLRVDPKDFTLVLENSQVRVLRLKLGPRQSAPMHEYTLGHLVVCYTDQNVRETSSEGKAAVAQRKVGDFNWSGPSKQKVENLSDKPLETVIVELKTIY